MRRHLMSLLLLAVVCEAPVALEGQDWRFSDFFRPSRRFQLFTDCSHVRFDDFAIGLPDQLEERIVGMAHGRLEVARLPDPSTGQDRSIRSAFDILDWGVPTLSVSVTGEGRPSGRAVRVKVSIARLLHNSDTDTENSVTTWERSSLHSNPNIGRPPANSIRRRWMYSSASICASTTLRRATNPGRAWEALAISSKK